MVKAQMSTYNLHFYGEIGKIIHLLSQKGENTHLDETNNCLYLQVLALGHLQLQPPVVVSFFYFSFYQPSRPYFFED